MKKIIMFAILAAMGFAFGACTSSDEATDEESKGSIYGIVTEAGSSAPIEGAGVELYQDQSLILRTTTYADGHYEFVSLNPGHYTLKTVNAGYDDTTYDVVVQAGRQARADMQISVTLVHDKKLKY